MARKENENSESIQNVKETILNGKSIDEKYKKEKCKVLAYNEKTKDLDIDFKGYGVRLKVDNSNFDSNSDFISIRYTGEIGNPNFTCKI